MKRSARTYNRIAMYDFDGTLFRSWEKTPSWWQGSKLDNGPFSFFINPESLDEPCVPEDPPADYWISDVLENAKRDAADRNTVMLVVTGRTKEHQPRVTELLASKGVRPQRLYFNPGMSAAKFKIAILQNLVAWNAQVTEVAIWENENQDLYRAQVERALATLGAEDIKVTVHSVSESPKPLTCGPEDFGLPSAARVAARFLASR